jgi:molecular chaperone DnaJ
MAKRDYYEILGLPRTADATEIKRAFRNRARDLHPDNKDSGDEAAFKELAEAYEVLSDEQRRALYDRYGHEGVKGAGHSFDNFDFSSFSNFGIDDIMQFFFSGGAHAQFRHGGPEQGAHLKYDIEIDFEEAVFGVDKKISLKRLEECETCKGSGAAAGSQINQCKTCGGMGQVQQVVNSWFGQSVRIGPCPNCEGSGKHIEKPCRECKGDGLIRKTRDFDVKIPAGIESGMRLRLSAGGDKGRRGGPYGDLFVIVHAKDHKEFVREGETIHLPRQVSFAMAALGGELLVPTVSGDKILKIPAGTQTGTKLVLKELGVPRLNNPSRRGDQIVHLIIETPTKISNEERKLLEQLAELRGEKLNVSDQSTDTKKELENKADTKQSASKSAQTQTTVGKNSTDLNNDQPSTNSQSNRRKKTKTAAKEDPSIIEKIVDAFRPKNGEDETK